MKKIRKVLLSCGALVIVGAFTYNSYHKANLSNNNTVAIEVKQDTTQDIVVESKKIATNNTPRTDTNLNKTIENKNSEKIKPTLKANFSNAIFVGDSITYGFVQAGNTPVNKNNTYAKIGSHTWEGKNLLGSNKNVIESRLGNQVDYIFIMYGANDFGYDMNTYKKWYKELIIHIKTMFPEAQIILQSVMPMENTQSDNSRSSQPIRLNEAVKTIAKEENVRYLDVAGSIYNIRALHVADGLHFKSDLYPLWLQVIKDNIQ